MIRRRSLPSHPKDDLVKVCDACTGAKVEYAEYTNMPKCFACGKDLCPKCASYLGDDRTRALCPKHQRDIIKFMGKL